jgi:hypothetical protein
MVERKKSPSNTTRDLKEEASDRWNISNSLSLPW